MSHIVKHDWNGFKISQTTASIDFSGGVLPMGYCSINDILDTTSKSVAEFLRLKDTRKVIENLERSQKSDMGNSHITPPIVIIKGNYSDGISQGTWACLELAMEAIRYADEDGSFIVWGNRTLYKVISGQEITNADRAEGWAIASQLGLNLEVEESSPSKPEPIDSEFWNLIDNSISRSLDPSHAIDLYLKYKGVQNPMATPPKVDRPVASRTVKTPSKPVQPIENNNSSADLIRQFADQCIIPVKDDRILSKADAYARYVEWCRDRGVRPKGYPTFCSGLNSLFPSHQLNKTSKMVKGKRVDVPAAFVSLMLLPKP